MNSRAAVPVHIYTHSRLEGQVEVEHQGYPKALWEEIIQRHRDGSSAYRLSKDYGISKPAILNHLKRAGNNTARRLVLQPSEITAIQERYLAGEPSTALADAFGVSIPLIFRYLRKANIASRLSGVRVHTCDEQYFDIINTPEKAYWLGFIAADGSVRGGQKHRGCSLKVCLAAKDRHHLEKLRVALNSSASVKQYIKLTPTFGNPLCVNRHFVSLEVCSRRLFDGLGANGISRRKTWLLKPPTHLPTFLYPHWLRGMIDGDGSITGNGRSWHCFLVGTKDVAEWARDVFFSQAQVNRVQLRKNNDAVTWRLHYNGLGVLSRLRTYLYPPEGCVCLERKRDLFFALPAPLYCRLREPEPVQLALFGR